MLRLTVWLAIIALVVGGLALYAQSKKAPGPLVYATKQGKVTFNHDSHVKAEKGQCTPCHDKLWPEDKTAPLNYKAGLHKPAEAKKTSCGACHHEGGSSFASKGNCTKCHVKGGAAKG